MSSKDQRLRRRDADDGTSLVEVLIAATLLATAFIALAQVATTGLLSLRSSADRTTAISLATQAIEAGRDIQWEFLALDEDDHSALCGDPVAIDESGALMETVFCVTTGAVTADLPFWGTDGLYDLETYVTQIDGFTNARRLTAVVSWRERGETRSVRESNVVAAVDRG